MGEYKYVEKDDSFLLYYVDEKEGVSKQIGVIFEEVIAQIFVKTMNKYHKERYN